MHQKNSLSNQWKLRSDKLFVKKAEFFSKLMQNLTGVPKINALSRKVAEIVTQEELKRLGISTLTPSHMSTPKIQVPDQQIKTPRIKKIKFPSEIPKSKPISQKKESSGTVNEIVGIMNNAKPQETKKDYQVKILETSNDSVKNSKINEKKLREKQELLNNVKHIEAFQEELQREYPELALNNSHEPSSFHTYELNELEQACKELGHEYSVKDVQIADVNEENQEKNQVHAENSQEIIGNGQLQFEVSRKKNYSADYIRTEDKNLFKTNSLCIPFQPQSPFISNPITFQSLNESPSKDFTNLQSSFLKASFLHCPQENVPRNIPRCHVSLTNLASSPIYFSVKINPESKVKCENGLGLADSLRRNFLDQNEEKIEENKDTYSKNIEWLKTKNERLNEIREKNKDKDLANCTFDPFFSKHEGQRKEKKNAKSFAVLPTIFSKKDEKTEEFKVRIPENLIIYKKLSPANNQVHYREGISIDRFLENAKPMVSYKKINLLATSK